MESLGLSLDGSELEPSSNISQAIPYTTMLDNTVKAYLKQQIIYNVCSTRVILHSGHYHSSVNRSRFDSWLGEFMMLTHFPTV